MAPQSNRSRRTIFVVLGFVVFTLVTLANRWEKEHSFDKSPVKVANDSNEERVSATSEDGHYAAVGTIPIVPAAPSTLTCEDDLPIKAPSFLIIGAQKGGTTALSQIIHKYTNAIRTIKFEGHYLDYPAELRKRIGTDKAGACELRRDYLNESFDIEEIQKAIAMSSEPVMTYDKTPRYIGTPGLAEIVHLLFSGEKGFKIVALLRNPVDRLYSKFKHALRMNQGLPSTVDAFVQFDYRALRVANLTRAPSLQEYQESVRQGKRIKDSAFELWDNVSFQERRQRVEQYEPVEDPKRPLFAENSFYKGMYAQQVEEWLRHFELGKNLMVVHYEKLLENKSEGFTEILKFLGLPHNADKEAFEHTYYEAQQIDDPDQIMSNATREYLQRFFKPHNDELADLLGEEWRGVWNKK